MELELKITCACHQAKIEICCQTPLAAPIAPKIYTGGYFDMLNPNFPSDLLSNHSSNRSFKQNAAIILLQLPMIQGCLAQYFYSMNGRIR